MASSTPNDSQSPKAKLWTGFFVGWLAMAFPAGYLLPSMYSMDLMGPDVALFLLFFISLMLLGTIVASWFWCKIPLPLPGTKILALWLSLPAMASALFHPEFGWEAFLFWAPRWNNHQLITLFLLLAAFIMSRLGPWFTRRFFYPELD
jgi:hypothetical protein